MIKKISIRLRLTIITSLIIIAVCMAFTAFSLINLKLSIVRPVEMAVTGADGKIETDKDSNPVIDNSVVEQPNTVTSEELFLYIGQNMTVFLWTSIGFMILIIVAGTLVMFMASGSMIKPVKQLTEEITTLEKDSLQYRITDFQAGDEIARLANAFNNMLERIELSVARESRFASDAAHELKTPLTVIKANLDVLFLDGEPSETECIESYRVIATQTDRMIQLVDDLLTLSMKNGNHQRNTVHLRALLEEILSDLQGKISEKQISSQLNCPKVDLIANEIMLKHSLMNIVENAIKYNVERGQVCIEVAIKDMIEIRVSDTGIGILPESRDYIFEPFYRADKSRSRAIGGAGLGLAITNEIIKYHNGSIAYLENEPNGSIFVVRLPIS